MGKKHVPEHLCPLCGEMFFTVNKLANHLHHKHSIGKLMRPCPCCGGTHSFDRHMFKAHFKEKHEEILAILHAEMLGVDPHEG